MKTVNKKTTQLKLNFENEAFSNTFLIKQNVNTKSTNIEKNTARIINFNERQTEIRNNKDNDIISYIIENSKRF